MTDKNGIKIFERDIVFLEEFEANINGEWEVQYSVISHHWRLVRCSEDDIKSLSFAELNGFSETCYVSGKSYDKRIVVEEKV